MKYQRFCVYYNTKESLCISLFAKRKAVQKQNITKRETNINVDTSHIIPKVISKYFVECFKVLFSNITHFLPNKKWTFHAYIEGSRGLNAMHKSNRKTGYFQTTPTDANPKNNMAETKVTGFHF